MLHAWRRWCGLFCLLLTIGGLTPAAAQQIDRSFAPVDLRSPLAASAVVTNQICPDAQGRALIGGRFDLLQGVRCGHLARLLPNGALDATFNPGGTGLNGEVTALAALPNGQWLVGGRFSRYNGRLTGPLVRLHPDGALDTTFTPALAGYAVSALAVDSRGRAVVLARPVRARPSDYLEPTTLLVRLLPTGAPDPTFQPAPGEWLGQTVAVDAADRVLVNRSSLAANPGGGNVPGFLVRLLPNGALDNTFLSGPTGLATPVRQIRFQPDGRLLVSRMFFFTYNGVYLPGSIVRLHPDGTLDGSFSLTTSILIRAFDLTPGGQAVISHALQDTTGLVRLRVDRLTANGAFDPTFTAPALPRTGLNANSYWQALAVGATGAIYLGADGLLNDNQTSYNVMRLQPNGLVDPAFTAPQPDFFGRVRELVGQSGERLLVTGDLREANGQPVPNMVRFRADGTVDPTFQPDPALLQGVYWGPGASPSFVIDAADRILANVVLTDSSGVRRFLPDGRPDTTFYAGVGPGGTVAWPGPGAGAGVSCVAVQPDGRILAGGTFTTYHGVPAYHLVRLLPDGRVDPSFTVDSTMVSSITQITCVANGQLRVLAGGGTVVSLDSTGTVLAQTLDPTTTPNFNSATFLPDGSWLLNGGQPRTVVKYTATGVVDPGFALDPALADEAFVLVPQPDGRLLVRSGKLYNALMGPYPPEQPLRRLLANGSLDPTFTPLELGTEVGDNTYGPLLLLPSGKLVIGGSFTTVNADTQYPTLVRLENVVTGLPVAAAPPPATPLAVFPNPAHEFFTLRRPSAAAATATLLDVLGRPVRQWALTAAATRLSVAGVPPGAYVVRVVGATGVLTRRLVVE